MTGTHHPPRLPAWFRTSLSTGRAYHAVRNSIARNGLRTVCESAACPNRNECWNSGTATFLLLGNVCTRGCRFCNVPKGTPAPLDPREPERTAAAVASLKLDHAVITSVTRDDLPDGGAGAFAETIRAVRKLSPRCRIEVLVPDFQGDPRSLNVVLDAAPDVLNHNIETVPSLYPRVRPGADYHRSLALLERARSPGLRTKSGLMLGLGESVDEVLRVMDDLRSVGCGILTIGQYLQPRRDLLPVSRYYLPEEFENMKKIAYTLGFELVVAGPRVRSSYHQVSGDGLLDEKVLRRGAHGNHS